MRMIKFAALAAVIGLLCACNSQAQKQQVTQPIEASAMSDDVGVLVVGTLAPLGSLEWQIAPSYTRLAVLRHNAARELRKKSLTLESAMAVMDATNKARTALDNAVAADARKDRKAAEKLAADGADAIAKAEAILRGESQ